ncbi:MAG: GNAT family N-acetyltransferase [Caulobacterales bacterium 32-69-10]|nr:MAG: GNAT family N-acetyltransferase [Caulobacterales bacterium 32-69-10]
MIIRPTGADDRDALWAILEPVIRAGETYPLPLDMGREEALAYWLAPSHSTFVAEAGGEVVGIYYLRPNNRGGGDHVANCGYMTAPSARGRGVARAMGAHSLDELRRRGFRAVQFNFVIATNAPSIHLWTSFGFEVLARLPGVFRHPTEGFVDALVMFRRL